MYKHASQFHQRTQFYPQGHGDSAEEWAANQTKEALVEESHRPRKARLVQTSGTVARPPSQHPTAAQVQTCIAALQKKFRGSARM